MSTSKVGAIWPPEWRTFNDPVSGVTITQLTSYKAHSHHPYFTEPGWYAGGRKLLFVSDRENSRNLYGVDLESGEITQLTDLDPAGGDLGKFSKSPAGEQAAFYYGDTLMLLDLETLNLRPLYQRPAGYVRGSSNFTADGQYICSYFVQDPTDKLAEIIGNDMTNYREYLEGRKTADSGKMQRLVWSTNPHSMIVKVATDGSGSEVAFEEDYYMGHANCSPTLPNIMTYCHEGPWNLVDNRIWGLDLSTGKTWKIRPNGPGESVGHEYWMVDGEHLGYHGRTPNGPIYGSIRYDNTDQTEAPFTYGSTHFHSRSLDLIVGDGSRRDPYLLLWRFQGGQFIGPKVLAFHRASLQLGSLHVHPCFSPYGNQISYTADPQGYGQVFVVNVPDDFDALPDRDRIA